MIGGERFPPLEIAIKIALSLGVGLLVGLEREWSHKDLGVRTFAITCLLGMLSALVGPQFSLASMAGMFIVIVFVNGRSLLKDRALETTTSAALLVTFILGVLVGQGHLFTPVASAIVMTMLLAWKSELRRFAGGLSPEEVRSAVLLGLLGFVLYPIIPDRYVDRWQLLNPREAWTMVIVIAGIGFVNYLLLRLYSTRGLYYSAVLGGLVNSTATVAELLTFLSVQNSLLGQMLLPVVLLSSVAMAFRNLAILAIFAPQAVTSAIAPLAAMALTALLLVWLHREKAASGASELTLSSPVSLKRVLSFGLLFLVIQIAGSLGERFFGRFGFWTVSFFGGLVSSASTTAAAASMVVHGRLSPEAAAVATVLATAASAAVNIPLVYRVTRRFGLSARLGMISSALILIPLAVLAAVESVRR